MKKRWYILLVLLLAAGTVLSACGGDDDDDKNDGASYTIGVMYYADTQSPVVDGFKAELENLLPGAKITYVIETPPNEPEALAAAAQRLVALDLDLILTLTTPASQAMQAATAANSIPIVFAYVNDPVSAGLAESLADPGGNMTGIRIGGALERELDWLLTVGTDIEQVYAPYNPQDVSSVLSKAELETSAEKLSVELVMPEVTTPEELLAALDNIPEDVDGILILFDGMIGSEAAAVAAKGIELGIPTAGFDQDQVGAGILVTYGVNLPAVGTQAARLANEILKGTPAGDLPVETGEFYLSFNLITAVASNIEVTDAMLRQANGTIIRAEE